jgi:prepilin-type N-terminal cleavage/methylation domain-containing protein
VTASTRIGHAGFTLLEVLVVLVVLGLLFAALAQGTSFGLLAWTAQTREATAQAGLDEMERTLRRLVDAADAGEDAGPPLQGGPHVVQFATRLPPGTMAAGTGPGALRDVVVLLAVDAQKRLVLRWLPRPHATRLGGGPDPGWSVLAEGVAGLDLLYGRAAPEGGGWTATWSGRVLPRLVRIHIAFPANDARHWPDIVVSPRRVAAVP